MNKIAVSSATAGLQPAWSGLFYNHCIFSPGVGMGFDPNCIFCKIVQGSIPCYKLYESETLLAFLDIGPVSPGHSLVIPKEHYETVFVLPEHFGVDFLRAFDRVGSALMEVLKADGLNINMNNKPAAGQVVPHAHWHLIPRFDGDGLKLWPQQPYTDEKEPARIAAAVAELVS